MHTVGVLDPIHAGTKAAVRQTGVTITDMKPHCIFEPDPDVLGRAAVPSGMLCRVQGYEKDARLRTLYEGILFLQAQKMGLTVLKANVSDCDYLLQLISTERVLFYWEVITSEVRNLNVGFQFNLKLTS